MKAKTENYRGEAVKALRRKLPDNRADKLNALIVDPLADLIKAASAEGYTREEIRKAIGAGAFHGWTEVRLSSLGELEASSEGHRFRDELGNSLGAG